MSKTSGFILREDTTARLGRWLVCWLFGAASLVAQFDPSQPFLSAAGKQTLRPGVSLTRWFEIEIRNASPEPRLAELLVFQCNQRDEQLSGQHTIPASGSRVFAMNGDRACESEWQAQPGRSRRPQNQMYVVAALLQPARAGLEIAVRAQYLQGNDIHLHQSPGLEQPPARREIRTFAKFHSALLLNASTERAVVRTCASPAKSWEGFADCRGGLATQQLKPGGALLLTELGDWSALEFRTGDRLGFVHALAFESSAGQKKHYEVDSTITFSEPK